MSCGTPFGLRMQPTFPIPSQHKPALWVSTKRALQGPAPENVFNYDPQFIYLVEGNDVFIKARGTPNDATMPKMTQGSKPVDGGNLIYSEEEYQHFLHKYPTKKHLLKRFMGSADFINNKIRFCLWIRGVSPSEYDEVKRVGQNYSEYQLKVERGVPVSLITYIREHWTYQIGVCQALSEHYPFYNGALDIPLLLIGYHVLKFRAVISLSGKGAIYVVA